MDMDLKLLAEVRERRDAARKVARRARLAAEEAETEYHELDETMHTLERLARDQADFDKSASDILG